METLVTLPYKHRCGEWTDLEAEVKLTKKRGRLEKHITARNKRTQLISKFCAREEEQRRGVGREKRENQ